MLQDLIKLQNKKFYLLPSGQLVQIVAINKAIEKVFVYNFESKSNEALDLDFAQKYFTPMIKIGELAKMIDRTPHTIRTYERRGLIDKARQFQIGDGTVQKIRLYSPDEIYEIVDFFIKRRGPGRPADHNVAKIDIDKVKKKLSTKYERKNDG